MKHSDKWFWVAIAEGVLLLGISGWICWQKIEEQKEIEERKAVFALYSEFSNSSEVIISMANYKGMVLHKNFNNVKKISFQVPHLVGMEWMCPAQDVERILQKCGPELTELSFACCNISVNALKILAQKCPNLKVLHLSYSDLEGIPDEISNLKQLEELSIDNLVSLNQIPEVIFKLKSLKKLSIWTNRREGYKNIKSLPPQLGQLENLRELDTFGIKITELPEEIGNLKNLESISIAGTHEAAGEADEHMKLPKSFGKLKNLKSIYMPSCERSEFPKELEIEKIDAVETFEDFSSVDKQLKS